MIPWTTLALLVLPLVPVLALTRRSRRVRALHRAGWIADPPGFPWVRTALLSGAGLLLALALSGPAAGTPGPGEGERKEPAPDLPSPDGRLDAPPPTVLVLDLSLSMTVSDGGITRWDAARREVAAVLPALGRGAVGLVVFAGGAAELLPPTRDLELVRSYLAALSPGSAGGPGSAMARGLALAREALAREARGRERPPREPPTGEDRVHTGGHILLVSDGETDRPGSVEEEVARARAQGLSVAVIPVGDPRGGEVRDRSLKARLLSSGEGPVLGVSRADPEFLLGLAPAWDPARMGGQGSEPTLEPAPDPAPALPGTSPRVLALGAFLLLTGELGAGLLARRRR